jgi:hypothetical protein
MSRTSHVLSLLLLLIAARAGAQATDSKEPLAIYEPNRIGYTKDSDDRDAYMDFQLSLRYQLPGLSKFKIPWPERVYTPNSCHFAFTTRLAQYIGTRDSSPVIGKRFNPKLFFRFELPVQTHLDLAYGHESNGQSIHELPQLQAARERAIRLGDGAASTFDQISRGWDYLEARASLRRQPAAGEMALYAAVQHFLDHGLLQGDAENSYDWELQRDLDERAQAHGLNLLFRFEPNAEHWIFPRKLAIRYETGTRQTFKNNSFRGEVRYEPFRLPLLLWGATGFDHDLAQFNQRVDSVGIGLEFKAYLSDDGGEG